MVPFRGNNAAGPDLNVNRLQWTVPYHRLQQETSVVPEELQSQGTAQSWQQDLSRTVLRSSNYRWHPIGKAGEHSKPSGTGEEGTSTPPFTSSSGFHKFISGSTIRFPKSTWTISVFWELGFCRVSGKSLFAAVWYTGLWYTTPFANSYT